MLPQEAAIRGEKQHATIERAAGALDDADYKIDLILASGLSQCVDGGPGNIHAALPVTPKVFAALIGSRADDCAKVEAPGVAGDKSFRKEHELSAFLGGLARENADFFESSLAIEYDGRGLYHSRFEPPLRGLGGFVLGVLAIGKRHELNDTASGWRFKRFVPEPRLDARLLVRREDTALRRKGFLPDFRPFRASLLTCRKSVFGI